MKRNTIKFFTQLTIVGILGFAGICALGGEPTAEDNFLVVFIGQLIVCASCIGTAWLLARKWNLSRKLRNIKH